MDGQIVSRRRGKNPALPFLLQRAMEACANAVVVCRATAPDYAVEYANPAFERMTGYACEELVGKSLRILHRGEADQEGLTEIRAILRERREGQVTLRNQRKDGSVFWSDLHISPVRDAKGSVTHFVGTKCDVTETLRSLRLRERAIEASVNAIIVCSAQGRGFPVEYVNPAFERMTGYAPGEVMGKSLRLLHGNDVEQEGLTEIRAILSEQREGHATLRNYRRDGSMFWSDLHIAPVRNEKGVVTHFVAAKYDVTETRAYQQELEYQANHDALTGLPNRTLLHDRLLCAIARARRADTGFSVAFIDLDRFKLVNDTMGHTAGDLLLKQVATRLQSLLRHTDTLARLGGDEFILIVEHQEGGVPNTRVVQRMMDEVARPLHVHGQTFFITASIGIANFPDDGEDPEALIMHADTAMYRAKETGRNNFQFYERGLNQRAMDRLQLEMELRVALEHGQFSLHYQPQVCLTEGRVTGMEALLRWNHPDLGAVAPARFIDLAEETGLIVPIGYWALRSACLQNKRWQDAGLPKFHVAVNVSARQFADKNLAQCITSILQETGLEPRYLELELTESLVMDNVDHTVNVLSALKDIGVRVSIDDFGTGYSSLSYLKRFPIDMLKIDRSFVRDILHDPDDAAIVRAIISLAHSLRMGVIAEGVEDARQLDYLRKNRCNQIQGYYISRPVPADDIDAFLRAGNAVAMAAVLAA
ncbi:putative bifunctional diguanylate cyclase/phosphodiesterase [Noviherbaspirillum denitrificans]|uniref:Diguanylate cyclase n=1 Tax=Noviherbaspirillum denitrificans TaxID=1968433 RepID=A0A254TID9_9BURK|nr:EAL domain-containing protein [Noviherbaspirillum denitrificans]OWW22354.1 hypothetical protein AYR66_25525 [Noviherbaspirillum denitrificans]